MEFIVNKKIPPIQKAGRGDGIAVPTQSCLGLSRVLDENQLNSKNFKTSSGINCFASEKVMTPT
jgi:hypothetical protein